MKLEVQALNDMQKLLDYESLGSQAVQRYKAHAGEKMTRDANEDEKKFQALFTNAYEKFKQSQDKNKAEPIIWGYLLALIVFLFAGRMLWNQPDLEAAGRNHSIVNFHSHESFNLHAAPLPPFQAQGFHSTQFGHQGPGISLAP
jgi:hypothetical protein